MSALHLASSALGGTTAALLTKVTAILLAATFIVLMMRRASAASRHLVWFAALSACVTLAVLSPLVPAIAVTIPTVASVPTVTATLTPRPPGQGVAGGADSRPLNATTSNPPATLIPSAPIRGTLAAPIQITAPWGVPDYGRIVALLWLVGCLVVRGRYIAGHWALSRLVRRSRRDRSPSSPLWDARLAAAAREAGISRTVGLCLIDGLSVPGTFGSLHPVVVLPSDAEGWTDERCHIVLVHELAHVGRFDVLSQSVANLACALFWFHPAAWWAAARLRAEAEQAADDRVLVAGTPGLTYATHLLELARARYAPLWAPTVAVGMASASDLEARFHAMLDTGRSRASVSLRNQVVATALACVVMVPMAALRTVASGGPRPVVGRAPVPAVLGRPSAAPMSPVSMQAPAAEVARPNDPTRAGARDAVASALTCPLTAPPAESVDGTPDLWNKGWTLAFPPLFSLDTVNDHIFGHVQSMMDAHGLVHAFVILVRGSAGWNIKPVAAVAAETRPVLHMIAIRWPGPAGSTAGVAGSFLPESAAARPVPSPPFPAWIPGDSAWPGPDQALQGRGGFEVNFRNYGYSIGYSFQTDTVSYEYGARAVSLTEGNVLLLDNIDGVAGAPRLTVVGCIPNTPVVNMVARALASVRAARDFAR